MQREGDEFWRFELVNHLTERKWPGWEILTLLGDIALSPHMTCQSTLDILRMQERVERGEGQ